MKLTIITINYNNLKGLKRTIDSVVAQTYKGFEWIVIDGGSTDGSKELIEQYAGYITYWVSEPDKGIYNAMNKGIRVSKGEYVYFLNSGDWLVNEFVLMKVQTHLGAADIINGNIILNDNPAKRDYGIHSDYVSCLDLVMGNLNHQSTFIKRDLFYLYGLYDENLKIVSDWKFFFYVIAIKGHNVHYINEDIAYFDTTGVSKNSLTEIRREREMVLLENLPVSVVKDYKTYFHTNEIRKYRWSRMLYSLLYRIVVLFERIRFGNEKGVNNYSSI